MHRTLSCFIAGLFAAATAHAAAVCPTAFTSPLSYDRGASAARIAVAAGDLNGDGLPDLVSLHRDDLNGRVGTVLMNRGREVFDPIALTVPSSTFSIVLIADINRDSRPDVVLAGATSLTVLPGLGDGTFGSPVTTDVRKVTSMVTGDFDEDGKLDLAVTQSDPATVTILLGDGSGGFRRGTSFATGGVGTAILAADFDSDHHLDLIVGDEKSTLPFFGKGDGTFIGGVALANVTSTAFAAGDIDGDGSPELVIAQLGQQINVYHVTAGRGFQIVGLNNVARPVTSLTLRDMDGDGKLDIVGIGGGDIEILRGTGGNVFALPVAYAGGSAGTLIDFDSNGRPDVAVVDGISPQLSIVRNSDGQLAAMRVLATTNAAGGFALAAAEMTQDDQLDLIMADQTTGDLFIIPGRLGGFGTSVSTQLPGTVPSGLSPVSSIRTGDFDGDRKTDLAILSADGKTIFIVYGNGRAFGNTVSVPFANPLCCFEVADMNGDGRADLVYAQQQGGMGILLSSGALFAPAVTYMTADGVTALTTGDLNQDRLIDVAVGSGYGTALTVFKGVGLGNLSIVGDLSGTDIKDVAMAPTGDSQGLIILSKKLDVFKSDLAMTFPRRDTYTLPGPANRILVVDSNGDGYPDLELANTEPVRGQWFLTTFMGQADGTFVLDGSIPTQTIPKSMLVADLEQTGAPELLLSTSGEVRIARRDCKPVQVVFARVSAGANGPVTFVVEAREEPLLPATFTIMEGGKTIGSATPGANDVGSARITASLPVGQHTLFAVATYPDGTTSSSEPLTVTISASRYRAARH